MSARGWADRLSGGPSDPGSEPPERGRDPGSGSSDRSNSPDPSRPEGGVRPRPPVHEPLGSALRVVLVSRDSMLAIALRSLIEAPGVVRTLDWYSDDLDSAIRHADVVVIDMPPALYEPTFAVIDGRFLGRTVVLLQEGEHPEALPPGPPRAVLYRPLQIAELWAAVTGVRPVVLSAEEAEAGEAMPSAPEPEAEGSEGTDRGPGVEGPGPDIDRLEPDAEVLGATADAVPAGTEAAAADQGEPEPGADAGQAAAMQGQGLPVAESGLLIGLSGRELEPVIGPGQVAPGMDEETLERLRRWGIPGRQPASGTSGARGAAGTRAGRAKQASAEARREQSRRLRAAKAEARAAARDEATRQREARAAARQQARQARQVERQAAQEASRQASGARAAEQAAARQRARLTSAAEAEARKVAQEQARKAKAARAAEQAAAREQARAAEEEARTAAQEEARQAKAAKAEARKAAEEAARGVKAAEAEARRAVEEEAQRAKAAQAAKEAAAREQAREVKAAQEAERAAAREAAQREKAVRTEARKAARAEARQVQSTQAAARRAARQEVRQAKAAEAKVRRAERAEARRVARERSRQAWAVRVEAWKAAWAEASQARATRRQEAGQARQAKAEVNRAARAVARQERAARAEEQRTAREAAARTRAAEAEVKREQARRAKATQAAERAAAREAARQAKAAQATERAAARAQAGRERAARAEVRRAERDEARRVRATRVAARKAARAEEAGTRAAGGRAWVAGVLQPLLVVLVLAAVAVGAAGWRSSGGPDTQAGEVAVVRAAGGAGGGLVAQDPKVGPISPVYALAAGTWLRVTGAKASLEGTVREARVPGRFLLAVVVALTVVLFLLLMRVGPGTGAAAGPGPAPPQRREGARRIGGAALAGVLVALDPLLVANGRAANGTVLALVLALGALALAWAVPARPALRWLPLVAALGGLALLVSPLVLPALLVPVATELLGGRYREAWRSMAAVALAIGVWLLLPVWVAGQALGPGQAGWLLGRPAGRGSLAASMGDAPLSWLLVATGLAAAILAWRHRSGARPGDRYDRPLAWVATTAAGALVAVALGYPAGQALAFATPAAAVALALAAVRLVVPEAGNRGNAQKLVLAGTAVVLAGLVVAQGVDWTSRYHQPADDGLGRLVATVAAQVPRCSAVNASGPDDRARLLAAGVTVTEFSDGPAATAAGVRYFVLTGATATGGPLTPTLAAWVREHGDRLAAQPSRSLSGIELWRVDPAPLDPVADSLPVPGGMFSNVAGSACGGYRVTDSQLGAFYTAYRAAGGKAVLGRPLGSVWTSDGPALQAFDTMVLGAVPAAGGPPAVKSIELLPLLKKLDAAAVAGADIPLPSTEPVTDRQALALLDDELLARAYLGTDPAAATPEDWRRARERFGRPLGTPQTMPDGAVRQPFERAVLELPADGGPVRPAALGRLAVRLGLVPKQAMRLEPVPGLPARPAETRLDTGPLLRPLGLVLGLLALAAAAGTALAWRSRPNRPNEAVADR